jgi:luciferase family oxidoreductase group 1
VIELMNYFEPEKPGQLIRAVPGAGLEVEFWMLGSSTYGAQLAAALGLPYAFASHFAPTQLEAALAIYRSQFRPSEHLEKPHVMLGVNVTAADTDAEAARLFTSLKQAFINLGQGRPGPLPAPVDDPDGRLDELGGPNLRQSLSCSIVGSPERVRDGLEAFVRRTGADELMVTAQIHDHAARVRSFEIAAQARDAITRQAAAST